MTTFETIGINSRLLNGIEDLGFKHPMPIQQEVIPALLENNADIIALAQTGTGKTAAFGLPIIQSINLELKITQALILSPTRELCLQIANDFKNYSAYLKKINIVAVYGGADIEGQIKKISKGAHIIVATPGRMHDLLNRRKKINISKINTVVLDEADEILSMGFKDDLDAILEKTPDTKRTLLFSATMPVDIKKITKNYMNSAIEISVGKQNSGTENVKHICYSVHEKTRYLALKRIVDYNPKMYGIIFCRTREETKTVARKLIQDGYNVDSLHGDLSQAQREYVMHKFRLKNLHLLTATDVAARGLDVKDLTHIINYNLPDDAVTYIHRSGRTGRAKQKGTSIVITNLKGKFKITRIEKLLKKKFDRKPIPTGIEICEKQVLNIVDTLRESQVDHDEIDKFLPLVFKELEGLSRDELIKHFVSREFNHFLNYYKNMNTLHTPAEPEKNESNQNGKRKKKRKSSHGITAEKGYTRFFINLGENNRFTPADVIGIIIESTKQRNINVGKIDIMKNFSFFEVSEEFTTTVLSGSNKVKFNGKKVVIEVSSIKKKSKKRKKK